MAPKVGCPGLAEYRSMDEIERANSSFRVSDVVGKAMAEVARRHEVFISRSPSRHIHVIFVP